MRFRLRDTCFIVCLFFCDNSCVVFFLFQGMDSCETAGAENTLLLVADVLATLAVTETGQRQLLYGETQDRWQRSR